MHQGSPRAAVFRPALLLAAAVAALAIAPQAVAAPPTLLTVGHVNRHPTATWSLPPGVESRVVEVATSPAAASDGYFFFENVVAFDVPEPSQTSWVYGFQLDPGTYYVHVAGYDPACAYEPCPGREWSNMMTLVIPRPPPPPPNDRPRIVSRRFAMVGHPPYGPGYYVTVHARFRVCDDSTGRLLARIRERKTLPTTSGPLVVASATWSYSVRAPRSFGAPCRGYRKVWRLRDRFFGVGRYSVSLRVRDSGRKWSNAVGRSWFTSD